jgi:hypothetical protein
MAKLSSNLLEEINMQLLMKSKKEKKQIPYYLEEIASYSH